jgi:hypothetical protein
MITDAMMGWRKSLNTVWVFESRMVRMTWHVACTKK